MCRNKCAVSGVQSQEIICACYQENITLIREGFYCAWTACKDDTFNPFVMSTIEEITVLTSESFTEVHTQQLG